MRTFSQPRDHQRLEYEETDIGTPQKARSPEKKEYGHAALKQGGKLHPDRRYSALALYLFAACLILPSFVAITGQSLWTDEAISAFFVTHARIGRLDQFTGISGISNMPLYHLLLTVWVQVAGDSERMLRSFNLPFALLFVASIVFLCRKASLLSLRYGVPLLFSIYPLLIYYVNDARPYTALLGLSSAVTVSFLEFLEKPSRMLAWLVCLLSTAAIGMHLFGVLCPVSLLMFLVLRPDARRKLMQSWHLWRTPVLVVVAITLFAAIKYITGGEIASKASLASVNPELPINRPTSWRNLVFVLYETLGFSGLGPPRNDLRVHAGLHTFLPYFSLVALGAIACLLVLWLLVRGAQSESIRNARTLLLSSALTLLALSVAARVLHFGFLGRHVMSLIGVASCAIALTLIGKGTRLFQAVLAVFLVTWGISSSKLIWKYEYGKDDMRTALQAARETGLPILWNVNVEDPTAGYYNVGDPESLPHLFFVPAPVRPTTHWHFANQVHRLPIVSRAEIAEQIRSLSPGKYVLIKGKADLADPGGLWAERFARMHPQLLRKLNGYEVLTVNVGPE